MLTHDRRPTLDAALASVLAEDEVPLELILVDNGTPGGVADVLGPWANHPALRVLRLEENEPIAAAHNEGLAAARGEFVTFVDDDDVVPRGRFTRQVAHLRRHPELGAVGGAARTIDATGAVIGREFTLVGRAAPKIYSAYSMPCISGTLLFRCSLLADVPFRTEFRNCSDYDLFARLIERAEVEVLSAIELDYRRHTAQVTHRRAAATFVGSSVVRLVTARRRAGRDERFPATAEWLRGFLADLSRAKDYFVAAPQVFLAEGFLEQAVYHARLRLKFAPSLAAVGAALAVLCRACARTPRRAGFLLRLFVTGPVRAHRLRPW